MPQIQRFPGALPHTFVKSLNKLNKILTKILYKDIMQPGFTGRILPSPYTL